LGLLNHNVGSAKSKSIDESRTKESTIAKVIKTISVPEWTRTAERSRHTTEGSRTTTAPAFATSS